MRRIEPGEIHLANIDNFSTSFPHIVDNLLSSGEIILVNSQNCSDMRSNPEKWKVLMYDELKNDPILSGIDAKLNAKMEDITTEGWRILLEDSFERLDFTNRVPGKCFRK